ncbi:adenine-specific DNA-methyltransferase [Arthrobacter sp. B2I5]|uniref:site-specific DNA-methyltransferase n=1 Tax=Arthrobacter sp. B2I5 TaxID=3042266 RepID=UPI0027803F36|nr:site-specific DNA-methyltransferase [Arthrobacter sp. B2I5]MDQ0825406.1 adenine-specific DNA-methyltransferase [Arthrobacter sp. B2I5]
MAHLDTLIDRIADSKLRSEIQEQINKLAAKTSFGLVFEEHRPETVALPGFEVSRGGKVAFKDKSRAGIWVVTEIAGNKATLMNQDDRKERVAATLDELVVIREFGDPIYPGLKSVGRVEGGGEKPFHTVINAENHHALEMLQYVLAGKVDLIYLDPPYNTGNSEWKYNDNYIADGDDYRHSKWLSFMSRRLKLARKLLTPSGRLVISIGSDEVHRLAQLCEEEFKAHAVHTITVQTSGGKSSGGFKYLHEYLIFVVPKDFSPEVMSFTGGNTRTPFEALTLTTFKKTNRANQTYPIYVDIKTGNLVGVGPSLEERIKSGAYTGSKEDFHYDFNESPAGSVCVWPISRKLEECVWRQSPKRLLQDWEKGYIRIIPNEVENHPNAFSIQHLPAGVIKKVVSGELEVTGKVAGSPTLTFGENTTEGMAVPTIWQEKDFRTTQGTAQLETLLGDKRFPYPKPVGLVTDVIRSCLQSRSGIVLDFFGGSGTTVEAIARLNQDDGGARQCFLVTNNELAEGDDARLRRAGFEPGSPEYEANGVFEHVTLPRLRALTSGLRSDGTETTDAVPANVEFFKLTYEDSHLVRLGRRFEAIAPILWMRAGAQGERIDQLPETGWSVPAYGYYGLLTDIDQWEPFVEAVNARPEIRSIFIVTDSQAEFEAINVQIDQRIDSVRLYSDYLQTFEINTRQG